LPVHSTNRKQSSCSEGVEEETTLYRFDFKDLNDEMTSLLVPVITYHSKIRQMELVHNNESTMIEVLHALNCYNHDDPKLIEHIKSNLLVLHDGKPLNLSYPVNPGGEQGLPLFIDEHIFGGKLKSGFFIEAGSQDAEEGSNTIHFEMDHDWSGLLVEAHPIWFSRGLTRHRKVTSVNTCLGVQNKPHLMDFDFNEASKEVTSMGGLVQEPRDTSMTMQCLPLSSLLLAMGNPTVHYFSLDIEGAELQVLKTIPWQNVDIQVISVETHLAGVVFPGSRQEIIDFMDSVGYRLVNWSQERTKDDLFVRRDIPLLNEPIIKSEL